MIKKILLLFTFSALFFGCTAQRSIEYLAKMKYKIHSVTDLEIQGVIINDKSQLGDFSPSDMLTLVSALGRKKMYASFTLNLLVQNPNPIDSEKENLDIKITSLPWELFLNDNKILTGNITKAIELKGNINEEKIPINIALNVYELLDKKNLNDFLNTVLKLGGQNSTTSNITLFVQPKINTIIGNVSAPYPIKIVDYEFR